MLRRKFLKLAATTTGGYVAISVPVKSSPLARINASLLSRGHPRVACGDDVCTTQDACDDDSVGHTCEQQDVCDVDVSGDCNVDRCVEDSSGACTNDVGPACAEQDFCSDDITGEQCPDDLPSCPDDFSGVCQSDSSGPCTNDSCVYDSSGECQGDVCAADRSGDCMQDHCVSDKSGLCTDDECISDSSGECEADTCVSDSSRDCTTDRCRSDSSGSCNVDAGPACPDDDSCFDDLFGCDDYSGECRSDSSGDCDHDSCAADSSGDCEVDRSLADASGPCGNDVCVADSSGDCTVDLCVSDKSGICSVDSCVSDKSGDCQTDDCRSDSSYACTGDTCTSDSSGECTGDNCVSDSTADCGVDRCLLDASGICSGSDSCATDASGDCTLVDVCVLDGSMGCDSDLCREDRSPGTCTTSDTCALDLAGNGRSTRRRLAKAGLNRAMKWLYGLSVLVLAFALSATATNAATVIDSTDAVFQPPAVYVTGQAVTVSGPVGPFLRDCDGDDVLEADTNGDGACSGDPEVVDRDGDGTRELPPATAFTGSFAFTCFWIPDDVAITTSGPVSIAASLEFAVFGAMRLASGATISTPTMIDDETSAWLSEDGAEIRLVTALTGTVDETQYGYTLEDGLPPVVYTSVCAGGAGLCGDANGDGRISALDALVVLRAAVGLGGCTAAVCDVDSNGSVTSVDALRVLRKAVGLAVELVCPQG